MAHNSSLTATPVLCAVTLIDVVLSVWKRHYSTASKPSKHIQPTLQHAFAVMTSSMALGHKASSLEQRWCCHISIFLLKSLKRWRLDQALHIKLGVACLIDLHANMCAVMSTTKHTRRHGCASSADSMSTAYRPNILTTEATCCRRVSGRKGLACAGPACWKPLCSNQSAVRVVSKTSLSTRWLLASCSATTKQVG